MKTDPAYADGSRFRDAYLKDAQVNCFVIGGLLRFAGGGESSEKIHCLTHTQAQLNRNTVTPMLKGGTASEWYTSPPLA